MEQAGQDHGRFYRVSSLTQLQTVLACSAAVWSYIMVMTRDTTSLVSPT